MGTRNDEIDVVPSFSDPHTGGRLHAEALLLTPHQEVGPRRDIRRWNVPDLQPSGAYRDCVPVIGVVRVTI